VSGGAVGDIYKDRKRTLTNFEAQSLLSFQTIKRFGEFRIDISSFPVTKKTAPGEPATIAIIAIASLFAAAILHNLVQKFGVVHIPIKYVLGQPVDRILYWLTFVVAVALGFGARTFFHYRIVTFEKLDLSVTEPDGSTWRSGYRHFEGVRERHENFWLRKNNRSKGNVPFRIVELVHRDQAKSILLFASVAEAFMSIPTQDYATAFRLPVLADEASFSVESEDKTLTQPSPR